MGPGGAQAHTEKGFRLPLHFLCCNGKPTAPAWAQDTEGQLMTQATRGATVVSGGTMGNGAVLYGGDSALAPMTALAESIQENRNHTSYFNRENLTLGTG